MFIIDKGWAEMAKWYQIQYQDPSSDTNINTELPVFIMRHVNRRFHAWVLFPGVVPIVPGILRSHQKDLEIELFFANLFTPF